VTATPAAGATWPPGYTEGNMAVYRRGKTWWYEFTWNTEPIREGTKQGNRRTAEQMEAAHRTALAKGEVGIKEKRRSPTLAEFAPKFTAAIENICADKPAAVTFYKAKLKPLVARLGDKRLDEIEEEEIEQYTQGRAKHKSRQIEVQASAHSGIGQPGTGHATAPVASGP
jgi:hypothetical protein